MENIKNNCGKINGSISKLKSDKKVLDMTQFLFQMDQRKHLVKFHQKKNIKLITDIKLFIKLKNFYKLTIFNFVKVEDMFYIFIFDLKNTSFTFKYIFLIKNFVYYFLNYFFLSNSKLVQLSHNLKMIIWFGYTIKVFKKVI